MDLNSTLAEIEQIEKSAGSEASPKESFNREAVAKFAEAAKVFKAELEAVEKAQPETIMKTQAGRAIALTRACMLGLEGAMSLIWESNIVDETVKAQFAHCQSLLSQAMGMAVEKKDDTKAETAKSDPPATSEPERKPTEKASAAEQVDGKNTPENHEPENKPLEPEQVEWPHDLNSKSFREPSGGHEAPTSTWGRDSERPPA